MTATDDASVGKLGMIGIDSASRAEGGPQRPLTAGQRL